MIQFQQQQFGQTQSAFQSRGGVTTSVPVNGSGVRQSVGIPSYSQQRQQQQYGQTQSYHTANYRGNQPGHDNSLRADAVRPSSTQVQGGYQAQARTSGFTSSVPVSGFGVSASAGRQPFGQQSFSQQQQYGQQQYGQSQNYHTANYRGNQPGHDNDLRADAVRPTSTQAQGGYQAQTRTSGFTNSVPVNGFGTQAISQQQPFAQQQQQFTQQQPFGQQQQYGQTQSYHTANYRGNQPGHDNSLRADAQSPSQRF